MAKKVPATILACADLKARVDEISSDSGVSIQGFDSTTEGTSKLLRLKIWRPN